MTTAPASETTTPAGDATTDRVERMLAVGAHYGYSRARRHPSTTPYLFGIKERQEIIDVTKSQELLARALSYVERLGEEGKVILFVSGKSEAERAIEHTAHALGMPFVAGRWIGGTLTNFPEVKKRLARLADLREKRDKNELGRYTKKERLMFDREIEKLESKFGGLVGMDELPHALFVVDNRHEHIAVAEAHATGIPLIALGSTDCDLSEVTYPILGNDASRTSISYFLDEVRRAYEAGVTAGKSKAQEAPAA